jgi:hypothetical protein
MQWEFANSFTTTTANCSISTAGELSVPQNVSSVVLRATFPTGTTGTAFLAGKDKEPASTIKPSNLTGWVVLGNGVTISNNIAQFTLSMSDAGGISTNVGLCAYSTKNNVATVAVNTGASQSTIT